MSFCTTTCCASCRSEAVTQGLDIESSCRGVCSVDSVLTSSDRTIIDNCEAGAFASPQCEAIRSIVDPDPEQERLFEKRVTSCNEAVAYTNLNCSIDFLNEFYPADLFRMAQDIADSPSCNFENVERYNLAPRSSNPQSQLELCDRNYNECKTFCFDQNVVSGATGVQVNAEGQQKYQNECQPLRAEFLSQKEMREEVIQHANMIAQSCQTPPNDPSNPTDPDDPDETAPGRLARALENPSSAFQNINGIISAIQPFMPQNQPPRPINSEIARSANPEGRRFGLTQEEMYGVDYSGAGGDADDFDFAIDESFDQPRQLQQNNQSRGQNQGMGAGGMGALGAGGMMGQGGANPGGGGSNAKKGRARRRGQKDKSLFGKVESLGGGSFGSDAGANAKNARGATAQDRGAGSGDKTLNNKIFNPSKYHDLILASYEKGMNSEAQKRAQRRAAGYSGETRTRMGARGYTSWHLENKIHPETISLFMQARICYNTKYTTGFQKTCAFSP